MKTAKKIEFGDYQTPLELANEVCRAVRERYGNFDVVVEPTCGHGAFMLAAGLAFPEAKLIGFDINADHVAHARDALKREHLEFRSSVAVQDFFTAEWPSLLALNDGCLLILGNLPWVTNSQVSAVGGSNVPVKQNFQGHRGIAARTGKANFDISEWMLIRLAESIKPRSAVLAMLCKTATARKLLRHAWRCDGRVKRASLHRVDAGLHFGAAVDACLLLAELGGSGPHEAVMFADLQEKRPMQRFGLAGADLVADLDAYQRWHHLEGLHPYQWRSGIKHDCSPVMELKAAGHGKFRNQLGETVSLEPEVVFPLLKSTPLARGRLQPERWVLLTQRRAGDSTSRLGKEAPLAWNYLQSHSARFAARKSSIYQRGSEFAIFGIGEYAFARWKVAVSALHRPPIFQLIPPFDEKPVMLDDTCYFIPFANEDEARVVAMILNSRPCAEFLQALSFREAKRPITVELLHRLNFRELASEAGLLSLWESVQQSGEGTGNRRKSQLELVMEDPAGYRAASKTAKRVPVAKS